MEMPPNPFDRIGIGRIFWKTKKAKLSLHVSQTLANQPAVIQRCIVTDHVNHAIATQPPGKVLGPLPSNSPLPEKRCPRLVRPEYQVRVSAPSVVHAVSDTWKCRNQEGEALEQLGVSMSLKQPIGFGLCFSLMGKIASQCFECSLRQFSARPNIHPCQPMEPHSPVESGGRQPEPQPIDKLLHYCRVEPI